MDVVSLQSNVVNSVFLSVVKYVYNVVAFIDMHISRVRIVYIRKPHYLFMAKKH